MESDHWVCSGRMKIRSCQKINLVLLKAVEGGGEVFS